MSLLMLALLGDALAAPEVSAIRVTAFNESVAVPYTQLPTLPVHPGLAASATLRSRESGRLSWALDVEVGGYHHDLIETALYAMPAWQPTWWVHRSVGLTGLIGIGYKHTLYPQPTYALSEDGTFDRRGSLGRPGLTAQIGTGLAVRVSERVAILAQYRGGVDGPFSSTLGMPVMSHARAHLGLEIRR